MEVIELAGVTVTRNHREVIADFSAALEAGTITAIVGANGSGKSTLLSAIAGDLAYAGSIRINGREVRDLSIVEQSQERSVVTQSRHFWLSFSVREILEMGMSSTEVARCEAVAAELDISSLLNKTVTELSGGEAQRVEIARALMVDRPILLLDEPLSAQDIQSRRRIEDILRREKAAGKTIAIVAHLDSADLSWCDQIINLS